MLKKLSLFILFILLVLIIVMGVFMKRFNDSFFGEKANHLTYTKDTSAISFDWVEQVYDDYTEQHVAIMIPTTITGYSNPFYFQLDTGSPYSFIYSKPMASLFSLDTNDITTDESNIRYLNDLKMTLGGSKVEVSKMRILEGFGQSINPKDSTALIRLGTIGSDFLVDRVSMIDFPNKSLEIYDQRPEWMRSLGHFESFDFAGRRMMLPVVIDNKELTLLYDSGCSAFGLITSKNRYLKYSKSTDKEISYQGSRWGEPLPIYHKPSNSTMSIAGRDISLQRISYVDMYGDYQRFMTPFTRMGGFLGNKPFLDEVLIIDTQQEEFKLVDHSTLTKQKKI